MLTYEYPLIERVRTLLRLEDLFDRAGFFVDGGDPHDHHVALVTLFEIVDVLGRAELKSELLQELERQRQVMTGLKGNASVDQTLLAQVLDKLDAASAGLFSMSGKAGQHLRENELLTSVKQRSGIPGGACEFDLPHYHHWLHRAAETRERDLRTWIGPLLPIRDSVRVVLGLLRESGKPARALAQQGTFQQMLGGRVAQMVRIRVPVDAVEVPEISANRYALNVRFTVLTSEPRPKTADTDIEFELTFCNL